MTADHKRVLVVEDEEAIRMGLRENLVAEGYEVLHAADGEEGLRLGIEARPDLVLLDLMLPGISGYEVCRGLRAEGMQMPVIMLTARQDEFDKLHGFEMGADDYITKPFSVAELMARVRANLARGPRREGTPGEYRFGTFILDMDERVLKSVTAGGETLETITLTKTEFELLAYFCANEGKALSRDRVMNDVWGTEYYGTQRSLDSFVAALRHKIEEDTSHPRHILTIHGVGYRFRS